MKQTGPENWYRGVPIVSGRVCEVGAGCGRVLFVTYIRA